MMKSFPILLLLGILTRWMPCLAAEQPSILLIYTDDVGYGDVGCYEGARIETPHIDRLAREGLRFTDAHCSAATCTPSRFVVLTGSYAFRNERARILAGTANLILEPGAPTLPSVLRSAGYATGVVGKWHLGLGDGEVDWNGEIRPGPREVGFDYHFLVPATGDRTPCVYVEQGRVVNLDAADPIRASYGERIDPSPSGAEARETLKQDWSHGHNQTIVNGISRIGWMTGGHQARWVDEEMADVLTDKALQFLRDHRKEPFFLYFSSHDIHVPRVPHPRFAGASGRGPRGDAMRQLDGSVGRLLDQLDELGLAGRTLVIFASDNGPVLDDGYRDQANELLGDHDPNGPWRAGKYSAFEGGTRTPFLVRFPGRVAPGSVIHALFGQVDLAATLVRLCGAEIPAGAFPDSRDALDTLLGRDPIGRPHLVTEANLLTIRRGPWKYIPPGRVNDALNPVPGRAAVIPEGGALYNLADDPGETRNLADEHPELLAELGALLDRIRAGTDARDP